MPVVETAQPLFETEEEKEMSTKKCSKCGKEKDLEEGFTKNRANKDGYEYWCRWQGRQWPKEKTASESRTAPFAYRKGAGD
jgi:hypothetical protein